MSCERNGIDFLHDFLDIKPTEIVMFLAIARKKNDPSLPKSEAVVFREAATSLNWQRRYAKIKALAENYRGDLGDISRKSFNIYASFNPRDKLKAYNELKNRFAQWDYEMMLNALAGQYDDAHISKINNEWYSCLQNPKSKSRSEFFLIDIDNNDYDYFEDVCRKCYKLLRTSVMWKLKTRNGYHILVKPFDTRLYYKEFGQQMDMELIHDGLVQVEWLE